MGFLFGSHNSNVVKETFLVQNEFLQTSIQNCSTNCTNAIVGGTIILNGENIGGNFTISQSCSINQGCTFNNTLQSAIVSMINSSAQQENKSTNGILSFLSNNSQRNNFDLNTYTNNVVTQLMDSECRANSDNLLANNLIYLSNANIQGNFAISQSSNLTNQCVMNNLGKIISMTKQTASVTQSNVSRSALVMIIVAIVILVIVLIGGGLLILLALGGFGVVGGLSGKGKGEENSSSAASSAASSAGLASEAETLGSLALLA